MGLFKRKSNIKLVCLISSTFLIFLTIFLIINNKLYNDYNKAVNDCLSGIIDNVKKTYPNVNEIEIIKIFNDSSNYKNNDYLKKYGLNFDDVSILKEIEKSYDKSVILVTSSLFIFLVLVIIILEIYFIKEKNRFDYLSSYIEDIYNKKYDLKLSGNEEDALSILQNNLYKLMIMLKEKADNEKNEKVKLKTSIEDISHQLKTPITATMIMLDNLCDSDLDEETKNIFLQDAKMQVSKMNFLIKSLLKLSRFEAGVITFKKENINVYDLINNCIKNISVMAELKEIIFQVLGDKNINIIGDYTWEEEAITNILKNAVEHSNQNGVIKISLEQNGVYTKISITNYGKIIDEHDLKNIFNRFYKGKNSSYESIGIGLSLSKVIIEKDGGYIKAMSSKINGTTFEIKYLKHL